MEGTPGTSAVGGEKEKPYRRRPHNKSRMGCRTCKRRKICDEGQPSCEKCVRHEVTCVYDQPRARSKSPASPGDRIVVVRSGTTSQYHTPTPVPQTGTSSNNSSVPRDAVSGTGGTASALNLIDLELMHQYCTSTCLGLHNDPLVNKLWAINVPLLGLSHIYVMHGMLALAALHLAHLRPERRSFYVSQAVNHHQLGLQKATPALSHFAQQNASAMYIFSSLTLIYTFASSQNKDDYILVGQAGIPEWIVLARESYSILRFADDAINYGPVGPMIIIAGRQSKLQDQLTADGLHVPQADHLTHLSRKICETTGDDWRRRAYKDAIFELMKVYRVLYSQPAEALEATDVYIWAFRLNDHFLAMLKEQTQEALVIVAFFAPLPKRLDTQKYWFLEGFSMHLISRIYPLIDERHLSWIEWPLREIGWGPVRERQVIKVENLQESEASREAR